MSELNRTQVGLFSMEQAITIEQIEAGKIPYITIEELFKEKTKIELEEKRLQPFLNGVKLTMKRSDDIYRIFVKERFIGIGVIEKEFLKRDIILL